MNNSKRTQWHPPFCAAVKLELRTNKKDLSFDAERILNTKPIQLDLLVIKELKRIDIQNEIGKIFRRHNIFEYKSPEDTMNIDAYFKTIAYCCLYKADHPSADGIKAEDITLSLVHEKTPKKLIHWFKANDCDVNEKFPGIYYITGNKVLFPTQLIVSSKLNADEHLWLKSLTNKMNLEIGKRLVISSTALSDKEDKENADSVLQLAFSENPNLFNELTEVPDMCEALKTLMKPEIDAALSEGIAIGRTEGIALGKTEGIALGKTEGIALGKTELGAAIKRLSRGETIEDLLADGLSEDIVVYAKDLLDEL